MATYQNIQEITVHFNAPFGSEEIQLFMSGLYDDNGNLLMADEVICELVELYDNGGNITDMPKPTILKIGGFWTGLMFGIFFCVCTGGTGATAVYRITTLYHHSMLGGGDRAQ